MEQSTAGLSHCGRITVRMNDGEGHYDMKTSNIPTHKYLHNITETLQYLTANLLLLQSYLKIFAPPLQQQSDVLSPGSKTVCPKSGKWIPSKDINFSKFRKSII